MSNYDHITNYNDLVLLEDSQIVICTLFIVLRTMVQISGYFLILV